MTDTIIKGTGNSRTLKTVPNALTLYPDHLSMLQAMVDGTFPIDLGRLQAAGLDVKGTDLNKANLLTDATETSIWGNSGNRTVDAALAQLRALITSAHNAANAANSNANRRALSAGGSYTGNGAASQSFSLGFTPSAVLVVREGDQDFLNSAGQLSGGLAVYGSSAGSSSAGTITITSGGFRVSGGALNFSGSRYHYMAVS